MAVYMIYKYGKRFRFAPSFNYVDKILAFLTTFPSALTFSLV